MRNKFFYGGKGIGIPTAKSLTTGRTWQRMLALFALIVTLGIGQMWGAAELTLSTTASGAAFGDWNKSYTNVVVTTVGPSAFASKKACGVSSNVATNSLSSADSYYLEISLTSAAASSYTLEKVVLRVAGNSTGTSDYTAPLFYSNEATFDDHKVEGVMDIHYTGYNQSCDDNEYSFPAGTKSCRLYRRAKWTAPVGETKGIVGTGSNYACSNQTMHITYMEVYLKATSTCEDPETALSLSSDAAATVYVGDEITFSTSGGNGGTVAIAGAASETITDGKWIATEGEHTFTASQAKNGNVCAQEDVLVLNVAAKTPVASVSISGDATAFIGMAKTLTATADQAVSEYKWEVDGVDQGVNAATFDFSAAAAGTYSVVCKARNSFNDPGEYISSSAHSITVTKLCGELIRATRNGKNIDPVTGVIGGTATKNTQDNGKLGSSGHYWKLVLASGNFMIGDVVTVNVSTAAGQGTLAITTDQAGANVIATAGGVGDVGDNELTITEAVGNTIWLSRDGTNNTWNGVVDAIYVTRSCAISDDCSIKTLTINSEAITPVSKVYSYEVAAASALTEVAVAYTTHPLATGVPASGFNVTVPAAGDPANTQTITVTAEDGTTSDTYTVSVSKAASASDVVTLDALGVTGYTLDPTFDAATLAYTITKAYGTEDPTTDKVTYTKSEEAQNVAVAYDGTNHKFAVTVTAEDNTTTQDYVITINEAEAPKNLSRVLFSNGFDAFIDNANHTVKAYYLAGAAVPTATTITAGAGTAGELAEGKITVTGADASTVDYIVTLEAVTPNTTTVAEEAAAGEFAGDEAWVKNGLLVYGNAAGYSAGDKWYVNRRLTKSGDAADDQRVIAGWVRSYFFVGNASKFIMTVGGNKKLKYSVDGGEAVAVEPTTLEIALSKGNHMIEIVSNQSSGDCRLSAPKLVELPPTYAVTYSAGEGSVKSGENLPTQDAVEAGAVITLASADVLEKSGYVFDGWLCSVNSTKYNAGAEYTMTAAATTFTALWEDNSKVAVIVDTNVKYESLADAIAAAEAGQTIQLLQNIEQANGVAIAKNLTLDLNGKTFTCTAGANVNSRAIKITAGNVTITNGTITGVPTANFEGGCYGALRIDGATANVTCTNVTFNNGRHFGLGIKQVSGQLRMEECTVNSANGAGGLEVAGTADVINCTFTQTGLDPQAWISTCLAVCHNGVLNVQGGTYTSEHYSLYVYTSGGEMDVESGSFTGDMVNQVTLSSYPDAVGAINISGGTFEGVGSDPIHFTTDNSGATSIAISGGTFDAPVLNKYCANGYVPKDNGDGTYGVTPKDGVEIIGVVTEGDEDKTVSGLYKGDATVHLSGKKIDSGDYIYVTLKDGYTFQDGDVLVVDLNAKSDIGTKALEISTGVNNLSTGILVSVAVDNYTTGENSITLSSVPEGQTSIGLKRSDNLNAKVNGLKVYRAMNPVLTAITIDGRDGEIDALDATHFSVTIPYEADLAALTVVPTIIRNAAHATTPEAVISNEGAWILGDNTYRVMDKDGDYTDYTITLSRDVLKHTVSFNTHGGSAVANELVVHGEYLAAAPADPTKEDYIFQYWSETEDGAEVDVTAVQINADKEFHAVWVSDGAIKLLDGSTVNHTNFITGVTADETVEFQGNTVNYAKFSGTVSGVNGVKDLTRVIAYNATTNKTKIQISAHNNSTSARNILVKGLVEGADAAVDLATIALGNKEDKVSDWIEFDNAANRTIYIMVSSSAGDVYFTQVKVIESGETPMKQVGEAGYSLNLNKGRFFGTASTDLAFEGLNARLSGDYTALNSGYAKLNATSMSFTVASDMNLVVTTNNSKTYYVTKGAAGTDNETAKTGESEFDLTAGTWYITAGSSEVQFTNIAFEAPKCAEPAFNALANSEICDGDAYVALDGTATVADAGVPTYQWYNADGDEAIDGATAAKFTPTADGSYYVIATNHLADHSDNAKQSATVTVTTYASAQITTAPTDVRQEVGEVATLNVVATGKAPLSYQWYTCDDAEGNNPVIITGAEEDSYSVTVTDGLDQYYKVVVSSGCGEASAVARIVEWVALPQLNVSTTTTWDWVDAGENIKLTSGTTPAKNEECVMANVKVGGKMPTNNATFNSQALLFCGENVRAVDGGRAYASVAYIKFNTTVSGKVTVEFSTNTDDKVRCVKINGVASETSDKKATVKTFSTVVPAGEVSLVGYEGESANQYIRISKIIFSTTDVDGADYTRDVRQGYYGTICLPNGGVMVGASIYEVAYFGGTSEKVFFDEIVSGEMIAGRPYIFLPREDVTTIGVYYTDEANAPAGSHNGLIGYIGSGDFAIPQNDGNYVIKNNMYLYVNSPSYIVSNRAYLRLSDIPTTEPALAPGCRRIAIGGVHAPTGLDAINADAEQAQKMLIDGKIYIIRGGHVYDAAGQLVK